MVPFSALVSSKGEKTWKASYCGVALEKPSKTKQNQSTIHALGTDFQSNLKRQLVNNSSYKQIPPITSQLLLNFDNCSPCLKHPPAPPRPAPLTITYLTNPSCLSTSSNPHEQNKWTPTTEKLTSNRLPT